MKKITLFLFTICLFAMANVTAQTEFITTWKTDNPGISNSSNNYTTNDNKITIPTGTGVFAYTVDWGDGTTDTTLYTGDATHTYATVDTYTVTISGDFPYIVFNNIIGQDSNPNFDPFDPSNSEPYFFSTTSSDSEKLLTIEQWGTQQWASMNASFKGCTNLVDNSTDTADTALVTNTAYAFYNATNFNGNISNWDVSNVTSMAGMFSYASIFNQDIGAWDVKNVTDMNSMFRSALVFNQDIGAWNVANVTDMNYMFPDAYAFNQDIGAWNVGNVTDMKYMFSIASAFNQDIGAWNVGNVTNMEAMFYKASAFNQDLSAWVVKNVTHMPYMFQDTPFNQDIGAWDISNVNYLHAMFHNSTLSLANYDNTLIGWNTLDTGETQIPLYINFNGGNSKYCNGETARLNLINTHGWTITDGGLDCSTLSTEDFDFTSISLFPNPAKDQFTIKLNQGITIKKVNMYSSLGQKVGSSAKEVVDISNLSTGLYFVEIETNKGITTKKFLVRD